MEAIIRRKRKKYHIENDTGEKMLKALQGHGTPLKSMKNSGSGMEYVDNECYFVFRKKY